MIHKASLKKDGSFYEQFLGFLIKKGNKVKAKKILDEAFLSVTKKTKHSKQVALTLLFSSLNSFVEVKKVRVRRRFVLVPFPINLKRRSYVIVKWIMQSVEKDVKKSSFANKLAREFISILKNAFSKTKKLRRLNFSQALANRANTHFRW